MTSKRCPGCSEWKPLEDFYKNSRPGRPGSTPLSARCRPCLSEDRYERRRFLNSYKLELGCADCGYREHPAALEFDHLPEFEKSFGIASGLSKPWRLVLAEIAKCEVVCANCHRIRTAERDPDRYSPSLQGMKDAA